MKLFKNKKGIILHPGIWILIALLAGMILMYVIMKGYLAIPFISC